MTRNVRIKRRSKRRITSFAHLKTRELLVYSDQSRNFKSARIMQLTGKTTLFKILIEWWNYFYGALNNDVVRILIEISTFLWLVYPLAKHRLVFLNGSYACRWIICLDLHSLHWHLYLMIIFVLAWKKMGLIHSQNNFNFTFSIDYRHLIFFQLHSYWLFLYSTF